jgi:hypothetical protein
LFRPGEEERLREAGERLNQSLQAEALPTQNPR